MNIMYVRQYIICLAIKTLSWYYDDSKIVIYLQRIYRHCSLPMYQNILQYIRITTVYISIIIVLLHSYHLFIYSVIHLTF